VVIFTSGFLLSQELSTKQHIKAKNKKWPGNNFFICMDFTTKLVPMPFQAVIQLFKKVARFPLSWATIEISKEQLT
jgi:hypothetical protein